MQKERQKKILLRFEGYLHSFNWTMVLRRELNP
jgi:hypothetical protein